MTVQINTSTPDSASNGDHVIAAVDTAQSMAILAIAVNHAIVGMAPDTPELEPWKAQGICLSVFLYQLVCRAEHKREIASVIRAVADAVDPEGATGSSQPEGALA